MRERFEFLWTHVSYCLAQNNQEQQQTQIQMNHTEKEIERNMWTDVNIGVHKICILWLGFMSLLHMVSYVHTKNLHLDLEMMHDALASSYCYCQLIGDGL